MLCCRLGDANTCRSTFGKPFAVVANKVDKVKKSQLEGNLQLIRETLGLSEETVLIPFSAEKGTNKDILISLVENAAK